MSTFSVTERSQPLNTIDSIRNALELPQSKSIDKQDNIKVKWTYYEFSEESKTVEKIKYTIANVFIFLGNFFKLYVVFGHKAEEITDQVKSKSLPKKEEKPLEKQIETKESEIDSDHDVKKVLSNHQLLADEIDNIDSHESNVEENLLKQEDQNPIKSEEATLEEVDEGFSEKPPQSTVTVVSQDAVDRLSDSMFELMKAAENLDLEDEGIGDEVDTSSILERQKKLLEDVDTLKNEPVDDVDSDKLMESLQHLDTAVKVESASNTSVIKKAVAVGLGLVSGAVGIATTIGVMEGASKLGIAGSLWSLSKGAMGHFTKPVLGALALWQIKKSVEESDLHNSFNKEVAYSASITYNASHSLYSMYTSGLEKGAIDYILNKKCLDVTNKLRQKIDHSIRDFSSRVLSPKSKEEAQPLEEHYNFAKNVPFILYGGYYLAQNLIIPLMYHPATPVVLAVSAALCGYKYISNKLSQDSSQKEDAGDIKIFSSVEDQKLFFNHINELLSSDEEFRKENQELIFKYIELVEKKIDPLVITRVLTDIESFNEAMQKRMGEKYQIIKENLHKIITKTKD